VLCMESLSCGGGGGGGGEAAPIGGIINGVGRVHLVKGRHLRVIGGGRGGGQNRQRRLLRSVFIDGQQIPNP
jgi:hypothetical protein